MPRALLGKARHGTQVVYVAGNHDRPFRDHDGLVLGLHRAEISEVEGIVYCNDGDWVESCMVLVEDFAGRLSILRWTEAHAVLA